VTPWSATSGVPSAPNATGAVLASNERPEASSGGNPRPSSRAPVTATGVPNPAAPSKNAPKLKAISTSCSRRSEVTRPRLCWSTLNRPFCSVRWYRKITFRMIHPIGRSPYATPRSEARRASPAGMPSAQTATTRAAASPRRAARCARIRPAAITPRRVTMGIAATSVDRTRLWKGSYVCDQGAIMTANVPGDAKRCKLSYMR
jgi:hypothetical protein